MNNLDMTLETDFACRLQVYSTQFARHESQRVPTRPAHPGSRLESRGHIALPASFISASIYSGHSRRRPLAVGGDGPAMSLMDETDDSAGYLTSISTARMLGMAVRSVQLMVDRGELEGWKTPGGHRRISRSSIERWMKSKNFQPQAPAPAPPSERASILLVEDSSYYQNVVSLIVRQHCPGVAFHAADDGIAGLAMYGQIQPDILIVDILLPGIDGAALVTSLRCHEQFARSTLIVITSLDEKERGPYAFALAGVPVVHKLRLVSDLPPLLTTMLAERSVKEG